MRPLSPPVSSVILALFATTTLLAAQPSISTVLDGALEPATRLAPGSVFVLEGQYLANSTRLATVPPLPSRLAGSRVLIEGVECPLLMVSFTTIYAQVPFGTVSKNNDGTVSITVKNPFGEASTSAVLGGSQPVLLTQSRDGKGVAVMVDETLHPVYSPKAGDVVIVYVMGLGETTPGAGSGIGGTLVEPYQAPNETVEIFLDDQPAEMMMIGLAPGLAGMYQIKIRIPAGGGARVRVRTGGTTEVSADVPVAPLAGDSLQNVTGTVKALAVPSGPTRISPILIAGEFSLSMGVPKTLEPFDVVLECPERTLMKMTVNPGDGSYAGVVNVPNAATRVGDFNGSGLTLVDLANGGSPMPGNLLPPSRMLPEYLRAFQRMAMPDGPSSGGVAPLSFRGEIPANGLLEFDIMKTMGITDAGVWQTVSNDTKSYPVKLRLVVNGTVIATQDVTIPVQ